MARYSRTQPPKPQTSISRRTESERKIPNNPRYRTKGGTNQYIRPDLFTITEITKLENAEKISIQTTTRITKTLPEKQMQGSWNRPYTRNIATLKYTACNSTHKRIANNQQNPQHWNPRNEKTNNCTHDCAHKAKLTKKRNGAQKEDATSTEHGKSNWYKKNSTRPKKRWAQQNPHLRKPKKHLKKNIKEKDNEGKKNNTYYVTIPTQKRDRKQQDKPILK